VPQGTAPAVLLDRYRSLAPVDLTVSDAGITGSRVAVSLTGRADSEASITGFLENLGALPSFDAVVLDRVVREGGELSWTIRPTPALEIADQLASASPQASLGRVLDRTRSQAGSGHAAEPSSLPVFELDAQAVGHPVGVGEVGDDLVGVEDLGVVESRPAERFDVRPAHRGRRMGQLQGVDEEGPLAPGGTRIELIPVGDVLHEAGAEPLRVVCGEAFGAQQPRQPGAVVDHSVVAVVGGRDRDAQDLPLAPAEPRPIPRMESGPVELEVPGQGLRPQAVDAQDVVDHTVLWIDTAPVQPRQPRVGS